MPRLEAPGERVAPRPSTWILRLRVASGLLFVPLLLLLAHLGGVAFLALVGALIVLGSIEFFGMMRARGLTPEREFAIVAGLMIATAGYRPDVLPADVVVAAGLLALLIIGLLRPRARAAESLGVTVLGVAYVGWLMSHLVLLRELPWRAGTAYVSGASFALLAFWLPWSCDTAAYVVGRRWGRVRPWKSISPRKTLEGAIAGFLAAVAAAFLARIWFADFLRIVDALVLGFLVGVLAQAGDLVESLLKRESSHTDSSDLIPGHGGVLDRFDSVLFAAPVVYYYLRHVVFVAP
jgi:phosphatidate cytidylyltransferase